MVKLKRKLGKVDIVTSRDNRKLVHARKVRDGKIRSQIFIEGRRLAVEALRSELVIDDCLISDEFQHADLIDAIRERTNNVIPIADRIFKTISDTKEPQGIVLIGQRPKTSGLNPVLEFTKLPLVLFLNEISSPSNLGAVLRTAEAAGVANVVISAGSADVYSPKAIRASMGSSFRLWIHENVEFNDAIAWAKQQGLRTTAADISATGSYANVDWRQPRLLIFGNEAHGLSDAQLANVDEKILIPMENGVESLNLGVSAGIILFEAKRQC